MDTGDARPESEPRRACTKLAILWLVVAAAIGFPALAFGFGAHAIRVPHGSYNQPTAAE